MLIDEGALRLGFFVSVFLLLASLEAWRPGPNPSPVRRRRWPTNVGLVALGTIAARLVSPAGAVGVAMLAAPSGPLAGFGLLHQFSAPPVIEFLLAVLLLDLAVYLQHRALHVVPLLWALHRTHHADPTLDASSGFRFHPAELLLSFAYKAAVILLLGASPSAVLSFEIVLSSFALFTHANLALPQRLENVLSRIFITPRLHRIHHRLDPDAQRHNFGFHLVLWDTLFGSFKPRLDAEGFGVSSIPAPRGIAFLPMLADPFRRRG